MKLIKIIKRFYTFKRLLLLVGLMLFGFVVFPFTIYKYMNYYAGPYMYTDLNEVPVSHTALVLGAQVYRNNRVSYVLYDRLIASVNLYNSGKVRKILASGDHGQNEYDEVNAMKTHLLRNKVKQPDIFLDHAGFDTYDSVARAKEVFCVKDVVIVTQRFHLPRAVYIARKLGLNAYGYVADRRIYHSARSYKIREMYARVKAFLEIVFGSSPEFLGAVIPVDGDGRKSWD